MIFKTDKIIKLNSFIQKLKNLILPEIRIQLFIKVIMTPNPQRKPKSLKFTKIYNSLNELERNEFRYFVLMRNVEGRNYEEVLKLISGDDFIFKKNGSINNRTLWNRISELTILLEKFLSMKELFNDTEVVKLFLFRQLRKRNLNELYVSGMNKYINELNNMLLDPFTFNLKQRLYLEASFFAAQQNDMDEYRSYRELFEVNSFSDMIIKMVIHSFDTLVNEIKGVKINSELTSLFINSPELIKIIKLISDKNKNIGNQLKMLHDLTLTFHKNERDSLLKAKEIFYKNIEKNSPEFNQLVFKFMLNYCIEKRERESVNHDDEIGYIILELFEKKINHNFYEDLLDPTPSLNQFRDFILLAGRKKIGLLNLYLQKVFPHVKEAHKAEVEFFVEAVRSFFFNDFGRSLSFFNKIKKKHYLHYFDHLKFSSMIYFETSKFVELSQVLTNFKTYVSRHKEFSETAKLRIFNFIHCLNLLSGYKETKIMKFSDLEYQISEKTPLLEREWLLKQLNKLK